MTAANFTLKTTTDERGPVTMAVTGELDATNAERFTAAVEEIAAGQPAVLDLSDLLYMDSAGFAALHRIVARHAVTIALSPHSPLRRAAALMGLPSHDTVEQAASALSQGGRNGGRASGQAAG